MQPRRVGRVLPDRESALSHGAADDGLKGRIRLRLGRARADGDAGAVRHSQEGVVLQLAPQRYQRVAATRLEGLDAMEMRDGDHELPGALDDIAQRGVDQLRLMQ